MDMRVVHNEIKRHAATLNRPNLGNKNGKAKKDYILRIRFAVLWGERWAVL